MLWFLCAHGLITCSINLVLLGKACFTVHVKMAADLIRLGFDLPLTALWTRTEGRVQCRWLPCWNHFLPRKAPGSAVQRFCGLGEFYGEKQPLPNQHGLCPAPVTWPVRVHNLAEVLQQFQGWWQAKPVTAAKAMHLTSSAVLGSTCATRGAWGLE